MSGGTKQQFKQFSITCAEDACLVLGMLISGMTVNLEKYKEYASEAESLLESIQEEYVPAKEYDDVNDKLLYRQREILKFTADHQSSSFSYIDLRKILEKQKYISWRVLTSSVKPSTFVYLLAMRKPPVVVSILQQEVSFFYCPLSGEQSKALETFALFFLHSVYVIRRVKC